MFTSAKARWRAPGGYAEVLRIGLPMMVSMGTVTLMQFTDRIFLGQYSLEALAASTPASIASFLFMCFFIGTAEYTSVFVAQYVGSCRLHRVGAAMWQGLWFCVPAWLFMVVLGLFAEPIFAMAGHSPGVRELEVAYFSWVNYGSGLGIVAALLSSFFMGRGMTAPVMLIHMAAAVVNVPLDYMLINGVWIFPEMGIRGAALATCAGWGVSAVLFARLMFTRENDATYHVFRAWKPEPELFWRFLKHGLPGGVQFFMDIFAFTFFIFMVGRIGVLELAATNVTFALNMVAFLPTVGLSISASVLVGQAIGSGKPELGDFAARNTMRMALGYMAVMCLIYVLLPEPLLMLFLTPDSDPAQVSAILETGTVLLRFVALYSLFDAVAITIGGALKGAGDVRYYMLMLAGCSLFVMVLPVYALVEWAGVGLYTAWGCTVVYVVVLAGLTWRRFLGGKWREKSVISRQEPLLQAEPPVQ